MSTQVRDPRREEPRDAARQLAVPPREAEHRQRPDRHLLRAVLRDLGQAMPDVGVREPVEQRLPVCGDLLLGQRQVRGRSVPPVLDPAEDLGIHHRVGDSLVSDDRAGVGHDRVGTVEQPQLSRLERVHVVDDPGSRGLPRRTPAREVAGQDPLGERLGHDQRRVVDAGERLSVREVGVGGPRRDPVDHGRRERDVRVDPLSESGIDRTREVGDHAAGHRAVAGDVVARHDGQRSDAGVPAGGQPRHQPSGDGLESLGPAGSER
jgi:hypothetical protein